MSRYPLHPRLGKLVLEAISRGAGHDGCAAAALLSSGACPANCELITALDLERDPRTRQHFEQIRRIVRPPQVAHRNLDALAISILTAFPDRVGRRRRENQALLAAGRSALLADPTQVAEFFVALDVEDRSEHALPLIRLTSGIQPEWLLDLFPDSIQERTSVEWNRSAERVEAVSALVYEGLVIEETRSGSPDPELAAEMLADRATEAGIAAFWMRTN